jgi:CheY-like chemotaxis protein
VSRILVVDDEQPMRELLAVLLADAGYTVVVAVHGRQALDLVERDRPDLILTDVMMPVVSGAELCRRLKSNAATSRIPIILMSTAGRYVANDVGADASIDKPFDLDAIEALVRRWLERPTPG